MSGSGVGSKGQGENLVFFIQHVFFMNSFFVLRYRISYYQLELSSEAMLYITGTCA